MFKEKFNTSIRFRFLSVISIILLVGTLAISIAVAINEEGAFKNSLTTMGQSFASYIAKLSREPLIIKDSIQLDAIVNDANKDENIVYAVIRDNQGNPLTSQYASINYRQPRLNSVILGLSGDTDLLNIIEAIKKKESLIEVSIPVEIGAKIIGTVTVGMSEYKVHQEIVKNIIFVIALNLVVTFALGAVLFVASKKIVFDPLVEIARASSRLARGDLSTAVNIGTTGEVKAVVDSFNEMVKNLEKVTVSKDYVDNIIGSMINTLIVVSPDDKIIRVNHAACSLLGYDEEELIGLPVETIFGGERSGEDSWMKSMFADGYIGNIEESYRTKGGSEVPVLLSASVMRGDDSLTKGIVYVAQDITEHKRAEEALRDSEEKYRNILDTIEDGYVETDIAGNLTFINPSICRMLDYSSDELKGMNHRKLMDETVSRYVKKIFESVYQNGKAVKRVDYELIRKNGMKVYVESSISLIKDAKGTAIGFSGIARDITERKQAEEKLREMNAALKQQTLYATEMASQAQMANAAKSEFLANMSHELRTPLNAIIGFTEVVLGKNFGELNASQEEYLGDVLQSSRHLLSLINDILDLSKIEAGKLELSLSECNLKSLLNSSLIMVREKAMKHRLKLKTEIEDIPEIIKTDERKFKQILYNLLSNAVKFTPDGGSITLSAKLYNKASLKPEGSAGNIDQDVSDNDVHFIKFSVSDTGIGIKSTDLERIFDPFEQADGSIGRKYHGTGLGLSLSKKLIEFLEGEIMAESEGLSRGSTFSFIIPIYGSLGEQS